jgi:hypothetical protein
LDQLRTYATEERRDKVRVVVAAKHQQETPAEPGYRRGVCKALNAVYDHVGLPAIAWDQLTNGERRGTVSAADYIESLKVNRTVYRKTHAV